MTRVARAMLLAAAVLATWVPNAHAQAIGSIFGKVTDSSGGVLPGVTVTVTGGALQQPLIAVTSENGTYQFPSVPIGTFTWASFLMASALFGAFHGGMWVAGTLAGMSFGLALYQRRALADAVQAHAVTNGLLALYAFATGQWSVWS